MSEFEFDRARAERIQTGEQAKLDEAEKRRRAAAERVEANRAAEQRRSAAEAQMNAAAATTVNVNRWALDTSMAPLGVRPRQVVVDFHLRAETMEKAMVILVRTDSVQVGCDQKIPESLSHELGAVEPTMRNFIVDRVNLLLEAMDFAKVTGPSLERVLREVLPVIAREAVLMWHSISTAGITVNTSFGVRVPRGPAGGTTV